MRDSAPAPVERLVWFHLRTPDFHAAACDGHREEALMDDLLWLAIIVGLAAATLAYVRLCDNA